MYAPVVEWGKNNRMVHIPEDQYNSILELMPIVCVDVVIVYQGYALLIKRANEPAKDEWWLPGGRLYKGETLEDCAIRKAKEETGLDCEVSHMIRVSNTIFDNVHSVNIVFLMFANSDQVKLDNTSLNYKWVNYADRTNHPYVKDSLTRALLSLW